eukprot:TRINITY_DN41705_c0_g1_i1.p1 TRINITY_DN41705_c0_g1~~TRINITY_DN41705_c0_g1_i1.p1  ORF type:complete len:176 (-),score=17.75 TRINITY_DN41705_c0_g1_i1:183-710(-)
MILDPAKQRATDARTSEQKKPSRSSISSSRPSHQPPRRSKAETLLLKGYIQHDARLRDLEGIVRDGFKVPVTLEEVDEGVQAGKNYNEAVRKPGNNRGPRHVWVWSAVTKRQYRRTTNPHLREALHQHMQQHRDQRNLQRVVRHCTMHIQRNQKMDSFTVHVHHSLALSSLCAIV